MKRKRITAFLAVLFMMAAVCLPAGTVMAAESGTCGKDAKWKLSGTTLTVSGTGAMTDYESVWDTPWIDSASRISKIVIGDGITRVGSYSFFADTGSAQTFVSLRTLKLGNTVVSIGPDAFTGAGFTSVEFPASLKKIGNEAFMKTSLRSVDCSGLEYIGARAFAECDDMSGSVTIGPAVEKNLDTAFFGTPVSGFDISGSNPKYSSLDGVLYNKAQTALIQFPEGKTASTFTVPATVTTVGERAFCNAVNISTLVFPDNVKTIKSGALPSPNASIPYGKTVALKKVFFGKGLKNLAVNIFVPTSEVDGCYTAYFTGNMPAKIGEGADYWGWTAPVGPGSVRICIPKGNATWDGSGYVNTWFGRPAVQAPVNSAAGTAAVAFGKSSGATGYQVEYSSSSTFEKSRKITLKDSSARSAEITGLKKGRTYYIRVRAYKKAGTATFFTNWSPKKTVKITK